MMLGILVLFVVNVININHKSFFPFTLVQCSLKEWCNFQCTVPSDLNISTPSCNVVLSHGLVITCLAYFVLLLMNKMNGMIGAV